MNFILLLLLWYHIYLRALEKDDVFVCVIFKFQKQTAEYLLNLKMSKFYRTDGINKKSFFIFKKIHQIKLLIKKIIECIAP